MIARQLVKALKPLRVTPFHPQWHVERYFRRLSRYINQNTTGLVLDVGCGRMEMQNVLRSGNRQYIGLDYPATSHNWYQTRPHVYGDGQKLPFRSECMDAVLLTNVLEHLPNPSACVSETTRVLKENALCIAEVPFLYPIHDAPLDFSRWTCHGLEDLFGNNGLQVNSITPFGRPPETSALLMNLALARGFIRFWERRNPLLLLLPLLPLIFLVLNIVSYLLAARSQSEQMPYSYWIVATKNKKHKS